MTLRARWRRWRRGPLIDEICRECFRQLHLRECWERRIEFPNTGDMPTGGGTFMTAYWCPEHRPADTVRSDPRTLTVVGQHRAAH